jgi:hypothetical protein
VRLADDLEARALQQLDEVEADDRLVFGYEDADVRRLPRAVHQVMTSAASRPAATDGSLAMSSRVSSRRSSGRSGASAGGAQT